MAGPTFTIGIPTRNRAAFLARAIECALGQTYPHVEIVVSDNASTDGTPDVVRRFGDRVRYARNDTNIGPWSNFRRLTELATGDLFAWFQDDCLLHRRFVERAVDALDRFPSAAAYACYQSAASTVSAAEQMLFHPRIYGPPVPADWTGGEPGVIDGRLLPGLALLVNVAPSPTLALRTAAARAGIATLLPDCLIYNERIVLAHAVGDAGMVVDPWIGGFYQLHPDQLTSALTHDRWVGEWSPMAVHLGEHLRRRPESEWLVPLAGFLDRLSESDRRLLLAHPDTHSPPGDRWGAIHPVAGRIHEAVWETLSPASRAALRPRRRSLPERIARALTPPLLLSAAERAWRALAHG